MFVLSAVAALLGGAVIFFYNKLVSGRQMTRNGWADIDVQLKRRADVIPQIVTAVKAYAAHERSLFEEIAARRAGALEAGDDPTGRADAERAFAAPVAKLIAVAEDYPDLKASESFLALQKELADTEDKIEMARRFYNGAARDFNIAVESVPSNFIASAFGFKPAAFFEIGDGDRAAPSLAGASS
ncbi:MAG: LemA family protein [Pseudomonadota bacterium]